MTGYAPARVCTHCGLPLDAVYYTDGSIGYQHSQQDIGSVNHAPDPVDPALRDVEARCDFCNTARPQFALPVRPFTMVTGYDSDGDWAVCAACAARVERNDWNGLLRAAVAAKEAASGERVSDELRVAFAALYRTLRANICGALRPL